MPAITVFTPTYNRAYILGKCYKSLQNQSCKDFEWLIIDDGSTDNTRELVEKWMAEENGFPVRYLYKENGGLHTGYNAAIANMDTELSVCIDSDDSMPENGIERILELWKEVSDPSLAGLVGLDYSDEGTIIGKKLPDAEAINAATLLCIPDIGDKKYVMRNDLWKKIAPMPVFEGERNFNPHYFVVKLSKDYFFKPVNECFCLVEYQPGGMSANIWKQYVNSPKSFAEYRRAILEVKDLPFAYRFRTAAHYTASSLMAKDKRFIQRSPSKVLTVFAFPLGVLFKIIMQIKSK